jgi:nucleoside-diphosphate-sugar epimerase
VSTVLVTGAGGFVGSAVVRRLAGGGVLLWDGSPVERVVALLRPGGSTERLAVPAGGDLSSVERADVHIESDLRGVLRRLRPRAVVNTALDPAVHTDDQRSHGPLETLFAALGELEGARIVHAGSAWVLAPGTNLDERAPTSLRSPYARYKAEEDELLPLLGERHGVDWIDLRLFNIFGRYEKPSRLLPYLVARLSAGDTADVSQGDQVRDFNDVDDIAEAFSLALQAPAAACGALYHVGSGRSTTVREFALVAASVAGDPRLIRFGAGETPDQDLPALVAEPSLARRVLGWQPEAVLEERIRAAAEWWLARLSPAAGQAQRPEESLR